MTVFLQTKVNVLSIDDLFQVKKNLEQVIDFLKRCSGKSKSFTACSVDIKGLYYLIPHSELLVCVEDCIDDYGYVDFQIE